MKAVRLRRILLPPEAVFWLPSVSSSSSSSSAFSDFREAGENEEEMIELQVGVVFELRTFPSFVYRGITQFL